MCNIIIKGELLIISSHTTNIIIVLIIQHEKNQIFSDNEMLINDENDGACVCGFGGGDNVLLYRNCNLI